MFAAIRHPICVLHDSANVKNCVAGRPAVHKLRLLSRVEDVLSTKRLHNELLDAGLLGGGWLPGYGVVGQCWWVL